MTISVAAIAGGYGTINSNKIIMTYLVTTNDKAAKSCFVRTNELGISNREFFGGFRRFLRQLYSEDDLNEIEGEKVLSLSEFDKWRKEKNLC